MLEPIAPLAFEEYQIPPSIIEESPVFSPPLMPEDINIFLSRFVCEAQLSSSIDDIVTSHKYTLSSASTDSGFGAESEWEEIVTVASLESIEMQRKAMPLEELLQRQDLAVVLEEDIKGADVKVDKWGFVIDETAGESNATLEESKKSKEDEAARAEKWVEVVAKWDTFSSDKKKKVRCVHCDPNHRRHHHLDSGDHALTPSCPRSSIASYLQMKLKFRKTGIPDRLRGMMWKKLADVASLRDENPSLFKVRRTSRCHRSISWHELIVDDESMMLLRLRHRNCSTSNHRSSRRFSATSTEPSPSTSSSVSKVEWVRRRSSTHSRRTRCTTSASDTAREWVSSLRSCCST